MAHITLTLNYSKHQIFFFIENLMKHEMHAQSLPSIDVSNTAYSNNEYVWHI